MYCQLGWWFGYAIDPENKMNEFVFCFRIWEGPTVVPDVQTIHNYFKKCLVTHNPNTCTNHSQLKYVLYLIVNQKVDKKEAHFWW